MVRVLLKYETETVPLVPEDVYKRQASLSYSDASSIPSWARDQVQICVSAGIISGYEDNTLRPLGNITRGEIAKILAMF